MQQYLPSNILTALEALAYLFVFAIGTGIVWFIILYIVDKCQTTHAIRHNYPVIGRLRYWFEHLGTFFRQYFFAMDREELPFNRAERSWVYRAAKNLDNTVPFGSTRDISKPGTIYFSHCLFPTMKKDAVEPKPVMVGPYCRQPYEHAAFFNISGMSYGAISKPAVKALSKGAAMAGIWLTTGEGGLSPYHLEGGCDIVFQIGTAKFGVRDLDGNLDNETLRTVAAHKAVKMIEIKLSQGAKPGKGGILPAAKVTEEIASIRGIPVGEDAISPNRFPEIHDAEELLDFIDHVRSVSGLPTGIKLCIGNMVTMRHLCDSIHRRGEFSAPDFITIDSSDGGTGAAPMPLMDTVGMPIRDSLPKMVALLDAYGLRPRIRLIASGKLITPTEVAWALCSGADFVNNARGFMFALGCIQAMQCNKNTCPTGITTHNHRLQKGLNPEDKSVRVMHYAQNMMQEVGLIAHACGAVEPRELQPEHMQIAGS